DGLLLALELEVARHRSRAAMLRPAVGGRIGASRDHDLRGDAAAGGLKRGEILVAREGRRSNGRKQHGRESNLRLGVHVQSPMCKSIQALSMSCESIPSGFRCLSIAFIVQRSMIRTYSEGVSLANHNASPQTLCGIHLRVSTA